MKKNYITICVGLLLAATANAGDFKMSSGMDYSSGKYGESVSTKITAIPVVAKYTNGPLTLKATMSHLTIKGPSNVIGTGDGVVSSGASTGTRTVSGWGDLILSSTFSVYEQDGYLVDVTGKAKISTADKAKGLTTGENDYSALVDVYKTIGKTSYFGGVGYKFVGQPTGSNYRNVWSSNLGLSHKLSSDLSIGGTFDYAQSISAGKDPREELTLFVSKKLSSNTKIQVYGVKGMNNNSADLGGGVLLSASY